MATNGSSIATNGSSINGFRTLFRIAQYSILLFNNTRCARFTSLALK
ncbi:MAG: hypothetical protein HC906_10235 [Bacteroidales bacterium]|nr:hypothetical protein [Bacteroidales bacterium]